MSTQLTMIQDLQVLVLLKKKRIKRMLLQTEERTIFSFREKRKASMEKLAFKLGFEGRIRFQ